MEWQESQARLSIHILLYRSKLCIYYRISCLKLLLLSVSILCLSPCSHFHEVFWEVSYLVGRVCLSSTIDYYHDTPQSGCIPIFTFSLAGYSVSLYFFQHLMLFYSTVFLNLMRVKLYLICTSLMIIKFRICFIFLAFLVDQTVKNLSAMQETPIWSLGQEDLWRRKWQPMPVLLPGEFHEQRSLVGYSPWGHKESDTTEVT